MNKKNLLNMIYLSKKGCYNHTNNNYDHNTKIINIDINNNGKDNLNMDNNKGKIEEKAIKYLIYFFA